MAKRAKAVDFLQELTEVSQQMQDKDQEVLSRREEEIGELNAVSIDRLQEREIDTRPLNEKHVLDLMESIEALGLIEPLVVDQDKVLLAGGHRLAAIKLLQEKEAETFENHFPNKLIPVRIMSFKATDEPERALQVEVAENEHRRDYTPAEVRNIAEHLRAAGYREGRGRPKSGEKLLMPALSTVIGKNRRTVQRYLHESESKNRTDVQIYLKKAKKSLKSWQEKAPKKKANQKIMKAIPEFLELIEEVLAAEGK
ncbi:MAG: ParB N-terminal domain-containing protein [Calditrichota bacterium]